MTRAHRTLHRPAPRSFATILLFLAAASIGAGTAPAFGATRTVNEAGGADYLTIQAAIDDADSGDTIEVAAGIYYESLVWEDKDLLLIGAGAAVCTISGDVVTDGTPDSRCLSMDEVTSASRIEGFTFTDGLADSAAGGAIYCIDTDVTITGCVFEGNSASSGGAIFCSFSCPTITECTFSDNEGDIAGAINCVWETPTISDNLFIDNTSISGGAAIWSQMSSPTISGNIIVENTATGGTSTGGGIYCQGGTPVVTGNTISDNTANLGGGIYCDSTSSPTITSTIITSCDAYGLYVNSGAPTVTYCNLYGNTSGDYGGSLADQTGLSGNISTDPLFADAAGGDYHVQSFFGRWDPLGAAWVADLAHSPCIDAGDPSAAFANEPAANGGRVNMGAYGDTAQASKSAPPAPSTVWVDDDYVAGGGNDGHVWGHDAFDTIQAGIDRVTSPGTVNVAAGTSRENVLWDSKDLQLIGAGVGASVVNGDTDSSGTGDGACLVIIGVPGSSRVEGFTFTDGRFALGGGIFCGDSASLTIAGNTISGNEATADGGGIHCANGTAPTIVGNTILSNTAGLQGGGINCRGAAPEIVGNVIADNTAGDDGGGISCEVSSSPQITGNTIYWNHIGTAAGNHGGGIYCEASSPTITNNIIVFAAVGHGIYALSGSPAISYCDVYGNAGGRYGGILTNQTGLNGNISANPLFADAAGGDVHLQSFGGRWSPSTSGWVTDAQHSPCIDAGDPASAYGNEPMPNGGRVNMGAWGNTDEASKAPTWTLTLTDAASGSVLVNGTPHDLPWVETFERGATVEVTAVPNAGWLLDKWSGDVPTGDERDNPLSLAMDQDRTVNTHFKRERRALHIDYAGAGTVLVDGAPQALPYDGVFTVGTTVTVDAVPNSDWEFDAWSGDVPGADAHSDPLDLVMDQDRTIAPHFKRERHTLTVEWAGAGTITVDGTPQTLPYTGTFLKGTPVSVEGIPNASWEFQCWDGDVAVADRTSNPLQVTMDGDYSIRPCFQRERRTLTVEWAGAGTVLVDGTPQVLPYTGRFVVGSTVEVTAQANMGWRFQVWSGAVPAGDTQDNPVQLVMDQDRTIKPHFQQVRTLQIGAAGAGGVLVNGVAQALPYTGTFAVNATVTVDAVPNATYAFDQWSGDVPAADRFDDPLQVVMDQDRAINPHFLAGRHLTVEWAGAGTVLIDGTPQGLPYEGWFRPGSTVSVDAVANVGYLFQTWSGDVPAGQEHDDPVALLMDGDRVIRPHFMSDGGAGPVQVMSAVAQPAGAGMEVCFTLSAPASVSAEVLNIAGRPIRRIATDRPCEAGAQSLAWNGRSDIGTRVPGGTYVVRLTACSADGGRSQTIATMRMR